MRSRLAAVALAFATATGAGAAAAEAATAPTLTLVGATALGGRHFQPRESVRLAFAGGTIAPVRVRASATGAFSVSLPSPFDPCSGLVVRATGARGDVAVLRLPKRECPPAKLELTEGSVIGRGFPPGVSVTLVFDATTRATAVVKADASGSFEAAVPKVKDRCSGLTVTATAPGGASAEAKRPAPMCAPALAS